MLPALPAALEALREAEGRQPAGRVAQRCTAGSPLGGVAARGIACAAGDGVERVQGVTAHHFKCREASLPREALVRPAAERGAAQAAAPVRAGHGHAVERRDAVGCRDGAPHVLVLVGDRVILLQALAQGSRLHAEEDPVGLEGASHRAQDRNWVREVMDAVVVGDEIERARLDVAHVFTLERQVCQSWVVRVRTLNRPLVKVNADHL
mmetsp:Transcript_103806/g.293516  ORF Transcript_103806/g.293516 Transcript_103806/m.293516 type:complete len:208 (-) Transcript_103806:627-1250(-)